MKFLKSHIVTIISVLIGVIATYYFYGKSIEHREPSFVVDPNRTLIVSAHSISESGIKVINRNGTVMTQDVTSLVFYFWNAGRRSIRRENILVPIRVALDGDQVEILDVRLIAVSRPEVIKATLDTYGVPSNTLAISFNILDEGDGIAAQVIFAGAPNSRVAILGAIEGAREIRGIRSYQGELVGSTLLQILKLILFVMASLFCIGIALVYGSKLAIYLQTNDPILYRRLFIPLRVILSVGFVAVFAVAIFLILYGTWSKYSFESRYREIVPERLLYAPISAESSTPIVNGRDR